MSKNNKQLHYFIVDVSILVNTLRQMNNVTLNI